MRSRLQALARSIVTYLTPFRIVMLLTVVVGLALVIAGLPWVRLIGVAIVVGSIVVLLAQLNTQTERFMHIPMGPAEDAGPPSAPVPSTVDMDREPLVSVIIPGRNEAAYLDDCIASLKYQTFTRFEAIIVDDASTDGTLDGLLRAIDGDPRFRVYRVEAPTGPGHARNLAVAVARADTVTFLDLDDFLAPESLATRYAALQKHADEPWLGGVYCWHEGVPASATYANWQPPTWKARNSRLSWLQRPDDNVFVVSAPLLRKQAFLAVGGFDDAIGEDARLWLTMLRAGFTFRGTGHVDIAYRQKPRSRAASDYLGMGRSVAERVGEGQHAMDQPSGVDGPYWFGAPMSEYRTALARANRLSASVGMAVALGDAADIQPLIDEIAELPAPVIVKGWEADAIGHAKNAAGRIALADDYSPKLPMWEAEIERLLGPIVDRAAASATQWRGPVSNGPIRDAADGLLPVGRLRRVTVTSSSVGSLVDGGRPFLIMPSAAYHVDELIHLLPELRARGYTPLAMINDFRWTTTEFAMARLDLPVVDVLEPGPWLDAFAGVLVFNDWGEYYADTVRYLADRDVVTFAKVEGVQDWHDRDTGRTRNAYLSADVVLCQGDNDVGALSGRRGNLEVVGSDRLERIWMDDLPPDGPPSVVANVNFTYGVLTEHRDLWVSTVLDACVEAGVPVTLSMHPSEQATYPGLASPDPLRHLLTTKSTFVSRFSTAIWEALARGCSVVYYNPHGEQVETFQESDGAFAIARSQRELTEAIERSRSETRGTVKATAYDAFHRQVSIVDGRSVAGRTADVIDRYTRPTMG